MKKIIIVTGANTGIGKATARGLAEKGCHVVMACRDNEKGEMARQEIIRQNGNKDIDLLTLDLSKEASIREFVAGIKTKYKRIDVLINNAGVSLREYRETDAGLEWVFAVNHLGPFLLTNLLLDLLKKSAPARIVTVASGIHTQAKLDLDNLNMKNRFREMRAYANSKLCNVYFTYKLARLLEGTGVAANCFAPGLVNSDFFRHYKKIPFALKIVMKLIGRTPEKGAETSLYLALSPDIEGITGKYFADCAPKSSSKISYDQAIADRLWDISAKLTHLG